MVFRLKDDWNNKAKYLVNLSKELKSNPAPDKEGGFLTLAFNNFSRTNVNRVGEVPTEKIEKYLNFSQEKAHRVLAEFLLDPDNSFSSWQTRNPEKNKWGGAVLFNQSKLTGSIISFSGLAELTDEAVSLMLGIYFGAEKKYCDKVAEISKNDVFYDMFAKTDWNYLLK